MAAPEYVPVDPQATVRVYRSPPRRADQWRAGRPGDLPGRQPSGDRLGSQGPDQGYALKLADEVFRPQLRTGEVAVDDAVAGCLGIALKRASHFGRAPTVHDLRIAFTLWGFLDDAPDPDLVRLRESCFAGVAHPHHYSEARRIVDAVAVEVLARTPPEVETDVRAGRWRDLLVLAAPWGR